MKLFFKILALLTVFLPAQIVKSRTWTDLEGKRIIARLLRVEKNEKGRETVILEISGRETRVALERLSEADQDYAEEFERRQAVGSYKPMPLEPPSGQREFLAKNHLHSYRWQGRIYGEDRAMPFQLYTPTASKRKSGEKFPLIVHLHGTGGIGTGNLKPLFNDAGGLAKVYVSEDFQRYQASYVLIPQGGRQSCWAGIDARNPPHEIVSVSDLIRLLLRDEKLSIDPARIYLIGLSLGGQGVFEGVSNYPEIFAAGIPIAYVGFMQQFTKEWQNTRPLWIAINKNDLYYKKLRNFRQHYLDLGAEIRTTVFEQKGHDAWTKFLDGEGIRQWLFRQKIE